MSDAQTEQMSEADLQDLLQMGAELSTRSEWQPACVARAFKTPAAGRISFTMQQWIDLDAMHSPLLAGALPARFEEVERAAAVFGLSVSELEADDLAIVVKEMRGAIAEGFAMGLKMADPAAGLGLGDEGFGDWLPILACLVSQLGLSLAEARSLEVGQAYALMVAERF